MKTFGENLQQAMKDKKITQTQMGEMLNLSQVSIGYYTKGEREPSIWTIRKFCEILEVTPNELFGIYEYQFELKSDNVKPSDMPVIKESLQENKPCSKSDDVVISSGGSRKAFLQSQCLSENDKKKLLIENIRQICGAFDITAEDIFDEK